MTSGFALGKRMAQDLAAECGIVVPQDAPVAFLEWNLNFEGPAEPDAPVEGILEIREWISKFIPHFVMDVITYPCWGLKSNHISNRGPWWHYENYRNCLEMCYKGALLLTGYK